MGKNTLWIVSELFPPEETSTAYILGEIANKLAGKYQVKVICGPEIYDVNKKIDHKSKFKLNESIEIFRAPGISENKKSTISRVKKFLVMSYRLYKLADKLIEKDDVVFTVTNPFPLIIPLSKLKQKRGFVLKLLVHDIFPEPLKFRMKLPSLVYNTLYKMFSKAYATTDLLISLGCDMTELLRKKTYKFNPDLSIVQIENWGDVVNIFPKDRPADLPKAKIVVQYAGNIGEAQGVQQFVEHIRNVDTDKILFSIWGTGLAEDKIKEKVTAEKLGDKVVFNGPYFRSQQVDVLNSCDIALVSLRNIICGLGVPSKSYNILAAGKPILFIGPQNSEIARMIQQYNIGFSFDEFDKEGIRTFLNSLDVTDFPQLKEMGARARMLAEEKYSKDSILNKFKEFV